MPRRMVGAKHKAKARDRAAERRKRMKYSYNRPYAVAPARDLLKKSQYCDFELVDTRALRSSGVGQQTQTVVFSRFDYGGIV